MRRRGFTLVELLVVIGIISLLISILLPSLARARESAVNVACQSQLRQIGQGLLMYNLENKFLPLSYAPGTPPGGGTGTAYYMWQGEASRYLGGNPEESWSQTGGAGYPGVSNVFRCPASLPWSQTSGMLQEWSYSYQCNPRLFPELQGKGLPTRLEKAQGFGTAPLSRRSMESVKNGSEKVMAFDGGQLITWNYQPYYTVFNMDNSVMTWGGHAFVDPSPVSWQDLDTVMPVGQNTANDMTSLKLNNVDNDAWNWKNYMRYRHMGNSSINLLYVDGHVESKKLGEVTRRMLCVNWK